MVVGRFLPRSSFARGVGTLMGGTAGSQVLVVLAAPIVTRLFTPADFGLLAVYAGLLGLLTVVASLRYELAIPLPEDNQEAADIAVLSLLIVALVSLASVVVVMTGGRFISMVLGVPALSRYFWLLPIGVFAVGVYQVFNFWALRTKSFAAISGTRMKQAMTSIAVQLAGYPLGPVALLASHAAGQGMGGFSLGRTALRYPQFGRVRPRGVLVAAKRYQRFPLYSTWSGLLNSGGVQLPALMFAAFFNPAAAGLYALTNRVLSMPMSVVGSAIGTYFFAHAADAHREKRMAQLVAAVHEKLAHIAMPPVLVFLIAGPELFAFVFGETWREAGVFARWMAPWLYIAFVTSPLSALFDVMERQNLELLFEVLLFASRTIAIVLGALTGNLALTIMMFAFAGVFSRVISLIWIATRSGNSASILVKPTLMALGWGGLCVGPLALGLWKLGHGNLWLLGLAATGILIGARFLCLFRKAD